MAKEWAVGEHVIYKRGKYRFPGVVTMRDADGGVVVKAFGDADGNYTNMKHIYKDADLEPYVFGDTKGGVPVLVIYPDENPAQVLRNYVARHGDAVPAFKTLLAGLDEWAAVQAPDDMPEAEACAHCNGTGYTGDDFMGRLVACRICGATGKKGVTVTLVHHKPDDDNGKCFMCDGSGLRYDEANREGPFPCPVCSAHVV